MSWLSQILAILAILLALATFVQIAFALAVVILVIEVFIHWPVGP
jgi:hypothetical protein